MVDRGSRVRCGVATEGVANGRDERNTCIRRADHWLDDVPARLHGDTVVVDGLRLVGRCGEALVDEAPNGVPGERGRTGEIAVRRPLACGSVRL